MERRLCLQEIQAEVSGVMEHLIGNMFSNSSREKTFLYTGLATFLYEKNVLKLKNKYYRNSEKWNCPCRVLSLPVQPEAWRPREFSSSERKPKCFRARLSMALWVKCYCSWKECLEYRPPVGRDKLLFLMIPDGQISASAVNCFIFPAFPVRIQIAVWIEQFKKSPSIYRFEHISQCFMHTLGSAQPASVSVVTKWAVPFMPETPILVWKLSLIQNTRSPAFLLFIWAVILHCPMIPRLFFTAFCPALHLRRLTSKSPVLPDPLASYGWLEAPPWF